MGCLCERNSIFEKEETFEGRLNKEKFEKIEYNFITIMKLKPYFYMSNRNQLEVIKDFQKSKLTIEQYIKQSSNLDVFHKKLFRMLYLANKNNLEQFEDGDELFLNVLTFLLSLTKSNEERKEEVSKKIIMSTYEAKDKFYDKEKLKIKLKLLLDVCFSIQVNCVLVFLILDEFEVMQKFDEFVLNLEKTKDYSLFNNIFDEALEKLFNIKIDELKTKWIDFLYYPIPVNKRKSLVEINNTDKQILIDRMILLFDGEVLFRSWMRGTIDNKKTL